MRSFHFISALLVSALGAAAQVSVDVVLDQDQYLRDEPMPVKVKITNRSGQTLKLGRTADWLTFSVESRTGSPVARFSEPPVQEEFTLESSMVATRRVDIAPYFDLGTPGRYTVAANVKIDDWKQEMRSRPRDFEILRGTRLWEQLVGLPATNNAPPEARKFVLQQAHLKRLTLYVRITDVSDLKTYRLFSLGPLVSFAQPEAQTDKESNLHVLFQTGPRSFNYSAISALGEMASRHTYDYAQTRPVLKSDEQGRIFVRGGQRRFTADDLPPLATVASTNNVVPAPR